MRRTNFSAGARVLAQLSSDGMVGIKLLLSAGAALALIVVVLGLLGGWGEPERGPVQDGWARAQVATAPALPVTHTWPGERGRVSRPSFGAAARLAGDVSLFQRVTTGLGDDAVVFNGGVLTYTIALTNNTLGAIADVLLVDVLPADALEDVHCNGCYPLNREVVIPEPLGGEIVVTVTEQVTWFIESLAAGSSVQRVFQAKVRGQADGTGFENQVFVQYYLAGSPKTATGNELETTVRVPIEPGAASLSDAPTWFSEDLGGTLSMDWADFDADGRLELALGSSLGATVYKQGEQGQLELLWKSPPDLDGGYRLAYGVRWADFDNNGVLELVVVGNSEDDTAVTPGVNYVYTWVGNTFQATDVFTSAFQLVRVAPGDYDGDGYYDLVVSTNGINPACPVLLYVNSRDSVDFFRAPHERCISARATANIGPGDFDNDGDLDLALGLFPDEVKLFVNTSSGGGLAGANPFTTAQVVDVDASLSFLPYDFAWGDYDGDGYLDLAAAFPLEKRARVYHNQGGQGIVPAQGGFGPFHEIQTDSFLTPLSIGWGDFDGDGRLDLAAASSPPQVYRYDALNQEFTSIGPLSPDPVRGQVWGMGVVDYDNDGDVDLTLSNRDGPSMFFTAFAPFLKPSMDGIAAWNASSVAWGDANGDGFLDLLFGAGASEVNGRLYYNNQRGEFVDERGYTSSGFGPQSVAFGDADGDGDLDLAVGAVGATGVYLAGSTVADWTFLSQRPNHSVAWGDADDDGDLDLLVGADDASMLFVNQGAPELAFTLAWALSGASDARSVAWGDYNRDYYLDLAVGRSGQPNQVYCNNGDGTFSLVWSSSLVSDTRSVAWADYDGDGDLDLAVGNYGGRNHVYQGLACDDVDCESEPFHRLPCQDLDSVLSATPVWSSTAALNTTSLAWGDWDNDGDPDLAVGNAGQTDQVYNNLSTPGSPQLVWLWSSQETLQTTGVAWGDRDGDGDLDLAVSQGGGGQNGVYENTYVVPAHLAGNFAETMPLANNPSYLVIPRPGHTADAYFFSSSEILSGIANPIVTIDYTLFDPDGTRDVSLVGSDLAGDSILATRYEFSVDGGGIWREAHAAAGSADPVLTTTRLGYASTFLWDAVRDEAIGDDVRLRITIVQQNRAGPFQQSLVSAISPPFRARGLRCVWPKEPAIVFAPSEVVLGSSVEFRGGIQEGSGVLTFTWDFGDGSELLDGQIVQHTFNRSGVFNVCVIVEGESCPVSKRVQSCVLFSVQGGLIYMPMLYSTSISQTASPNSTQRVRQGPFELSPEQVKGLRGYVSDQATFLMWPPAASADEALAGYRVYRRDLAGEDVFRLVATLPADANAYTDETASCGRVYYVTAFNSAGESSPSAASYYSLPCQE